MHGQSSKRRREPTSLARAVRMVVSCIVTSLIGLSAGLAGAENPHCRAADIEDRAPRYGLTTAPDVNACRPTGATPELTVDARDSDEACATGDCRDLLFARPTRCQLHKRTPERKFMKCGGEDRRLVTVGPNGIVAVRMLPNGAARNPYPLELVAQWRYCPFAADAALEKALVPYEDPDIGRCYLLRPRPPDGVTTRGLRTESLSTLHPYLADAMERLLVLARARGDEFRVISTIRAAKKVSKTNTRRVKERGRWKTESSTITRYQGGGWHAFGLAIDINIEGRKDLGSATATFLRGGPEGAAWLRIGAQAESFGLIWLGRSDPNEIFHFEWHPGWPGMPKGALYQSLAKEADTRGIPSIWPRLASKNISTSPFRHLRDERAPLPAAASRGLPDDAVFEDPSTKKTTRKPSRKRRNAKAKAAESAPEAIPATLAVRESLKPESKAPKATRADAKKTVKLAAKEAKTKKAEAKRATEKAAKLAAKEAMAKKSEGAKSEGAKSEGAKSEGAKKEGQPAALHKKDLGSTKPTPKRPGSKRVTPNKPRAEEDAKDTPKPPSKPTSTRKDGGPTVKPIKPKPGRPKRG